MAKAHEIRPRFWEKHALSDMTEAEWEAVCDGCGKCCLIKLEDAETGQVEYTNVACKLFDDTTCRCSDYDIRKSIVPSCVVLSPDTIEAASYWLPNSCGYKLLHQGYKLPLWHPLLNGGAEAMHEAGASMINRTIPEYEVDEEDLEEFIVEGLQ